MRKLLFVFILASSLPAYALRLGVHGGVNSSNFGSDANVNYNGKSGLLIGGIIESKMGAFFSLQLEADYVQKGISGTNLNYFEIPALLRLNLPFPIITPFAMAGPSLGFLSSATNSSGADIKSNFSGTDFGLIVGGGVELAMGPVAALIVQLRYQIGLTDVDKAAGTLKNNGFQVTGGLLFGF